MKTNLKTTEDLPNDISLDQAIDMTTRYRQNKTTILNQGVDTNVLPISETFDQSALAALLAVPGCSFIRVYYGMSENMYIHTILVAADANGADILPAGNTAVHGKEALESGEPGIKEDGQRCPPDCPPPSPLNP
jgi:hypothetical protein